jgi:hypothetical protein
MTNITTPTDTTRSAKTTTKVTTTHLKRSQKVRLARTITVEGETLPKNLRLDVMALQPNGRVKATIRDPNFPALTGRRVSVAPSNLKRTFRGRPRVVGE